MSTKDPYKPYRDEHGKVNMDAYTDSVFKREAERLKRQQEEGKRRAWSDADRATALAALDANGGNLLRTSKELGIPLSTLKNWRDGTRGTANVAELGNQKKDALEGKLEATLHQLLDAIPERIPDANLQQVTTSAGIIADKLIALRDSRKGEPPQDHAHDEQRTLDDLLRDNPELQDVARPLLRKLATLGMDGASGPRPSEQRGEVEPDRSPDAPE